MGALVKLAQGRSLRALLLAPSAVSRFITTASRRALATTNERPAALLANRRAGATRAQGQRGQLLIRQVAKVPLYAAGQSDRRPNN